LTGAAYKRRQILVQEGKFARKLNTKSPCKLGDQIKKLDAKINWKDESADTLLDKMKLSRLQTSYGSAKIITESTE
jgi:hypothetical protein